MKIYLEIIPTEELKDGEIPTEIYKEEFASKSEAESKLADKKKDFIGKNYKSYIHYCYHSDKNDGRNQPCRREILEEIIDK